ncbi:MAG: hypothetical protein QSU88_07230, partial [Candidatus Methanoperedens sp.]|nr:hypothetical protein [Candidatus Methanoperedens sp.]
PIVPVLAITYSSIYPTTNSYFFQQLPITCKNGGNAEFIFAHAWRNLNVGGTIARTGLHNIKPSTYC